MRRMYSSVSPKGQVTIPAEIRQQLGLKPKDRVEFEVEDGVVKVRRAESRLRRFYQSVPALPIPLTDKEITDIAWEEHVMEWARKDREQQEGTD